MEWSGPEPRREDVCAVGGRARELEPLRPLGTSPLLKFGFALLCDSLILSSWSKKVFNLLFDFSATNSYEIFKGDFGL